MRRRSWRIASASASSTAFTTTRCFTPSVESLEWDEAKSRWIIQHQSRRRLHGAISSAWARARCTCPSCPALPASSPSRDIRSIPAAGITTTPAAIRQGALMDKLADKRVGIIGTGATSVQCVPYLARACKELYVFQRTPSSVDVRANAPIDPEWFSAIATPGWQQRWLENFTANQAGGTARGRSGPGRLDRSVAAHPQPGSCSCRASSASLQNMLAAFEDSDFEKMEEIRSAGRHASSRTARPPASSRPGIASSASGRASMTRICRPSTRRARI